jgi:glycosyltransferase involved in cell wall biosynthesis
MIDVVMPTYNRAASIRKVVDSYFAQPELGSFIIVDDCSTDDTTAFAAELAKQYPGKVVYYRFEKKTTLPAVRNMGISLVTNEYVFMGEDDVLLPENHFKILIEKMREYDAAIIAGRRIYIREGESLEDAKNVADFDRGPLFVHVPFEGYFERYVSAPQRVPYIHSNSLLRRAVFSSVLYDPWYGGNAFREELDFYLRAHDAGFPIWIIPDTLSYHMKNTSTNRSGGSRKKRFVYEWQVWRNTIHCFWKNRLIFTKEFGVKNVFVFTLRCLFARYSYALKRRIDWLTHGTHKET